MASFWRMAARRNGRAKTPVTPLAIPSARRVRSCCCIEVHAQLLDPRRVAISVGSIRRRAFRRVLRPSRRLRKLPDIRESNAALRCIRRGFTKHTSRRWRTLVIGDEIDDLPAARVLADVIGGHYVVIIFRGDAGAINSGAMARCCNRIHPRIDVGFLFWQHASALLLIEKDNSSRGEAFTAGRGGGGMPIAGPKISSIRDRLQFCIQPSVEQHQKSKSRSIDRLAFANPAIRLFSGRIVQPISRERESLAQRMKTIVARIFVAIKTKVEDLRKCRLHRTVNRECNVNCK